MHSVISQESVTKAAIWAARLPGTQLFPGGCAVLGRLTPALDLALGHRMTGRTRAHRTCSKF